MLFLKEANMNDIDCEYECVTNTPLDENGFTNSDYGCTREEFEKTILPSFLDKAKGIGLPEGWVPGTEYFLWDDDKLVGWFRIRHYLTPSLENGAGHIGYCIRKEYRGNGYATKGLALTIELARKIIPESEIYMSVHKDNAASLCVQEKNGAYIHHEDETEYYTRVKK